MMLLKCDVRYVVPVIDEIDLTRMNMVQRLIDIDILLCTCLYDDKLILRLS